MNFWEFLDNLSGSRLTSPLYKSFIIAWVFWNWNFLYLLFFESGELILQEEGVLKYELLESYFTLSWNNFYFGLLFPLLSVAIFYFCLPHIELFIRRIANDNRKKQIEIDKELKKDESEARRFETENKIKELEKENKLLKEKQKKKESEKEVEESEFRKEYEIFREIPDSGKILSHLKHLVDSTSVPSSSERMYKSEIETFGLYDYDNYNLTDKGKYFLRQEILRNG